MSKLLITIAFLILVLTACGGDNMRGGLLDNPLDMTHRAEIRAERDKFIAMENTKARMAEAQAIADAAYYEASAKKVQSRNETYRAAVWASTAWFVAVVILVGSVLVVAMIQLVKLMLGREINKIREVW